MSLRHPLFLVSPHQKRPEFWVTPAEIRENVEDVSAQADYSDVSLRKVVHEATADGGRVSVAALYSDFSLKDIFKRTSVDDTHVSAEARYEDFSLKDVLRFAKAEDGATAASGYSDIRIISVGFYAQVLDEDKAEATASYSAISLIGEQ